MNDRSGTGRHARRLDGPTASARFVNQQARQVAARFKELHPEVHADVDDLAPLWAAANAQNGARVGRPPSDKWLLTGLVRCGHCGNSMVVWTGASRRNGKAQKVSRRYRCSNRSCPSRPKQTVDAPTLEAWTLDTLWTLLGARAEGEQPEAVDLTPLVAAVQKAETRLEQSLAPEAQDALGERWATTVKERRQAHEAALAALGEARQRSGQETAAEIIDLRERWDDMTPTERREALRRYAIEAVVVSAKTPDGWELVLR